MLLTCFFLGISAAGVIGSSCMITSSSSSSSLRIALLLHLSICMCRSCDKGELDHSEIPLYCIISRQHQNRPSPRHHHITSNTPQLIPASASPTARLQRIYRESPRAQTLVVIAQDETRRCCCCSGTRWISGCYSCCPCSDSSWNISRRRSRLWANLERRVRASHRGLKLVH